MVCIRPVSIAVISGLPEIFAIGSERERNVQVWGGEEMHIPEPGGGSVFIAAALLNFVYYDEREREVYPAPHYIGTIGANEKQNWHFVSFPPLHILSGMGIPLRVYVKMHGNGPVSVTHAVVEQ